MLSWDSSCLCFSWRCCCCFVLLISFRWLRWLTLSNLCCFVAPSLQCAHTLSLHTSHLKCFLNENRNRNVEMIYFYLKGLTLRVQLFSSVCVCGVRRDYETQRLLLLFMNQSRSVCVYLCVKGIVREHWAVSTSKITTDEDKDLLQSKLHRTQHARTHAHFLPPRRREREREHDRTRRKLISKNDCVSIYAPSTTTTTMPKTTTDNDGKWLLTNRLSEYSVVRINNNEAFLVSWRQIN